MRKDDRNSTEPEFSYEYNGQCRPAERDRQIADTNKTAYELMYDKAKGGHDVVEFQYS